MALPLLAGAALASTSSVSGGSTALGSALSLGSGASLLSGVTSLGKVFAPKDSKEKPFDVRKRKRDAYYASKDAILAKWKSESPGFNPAQSVAAIDQWIDFEEKALADTIAWKAQDPEGKHWEEPSIMKGTLSNLRKNRAGVIDQNPAVFATMQSGVFGGSAQASPVGYTQVMTTDANGNPIAVNVPSSQATPAKGRSPLTWIIPLSGVVVSVVLFLVLGRKKKRR